jgi:hypothetical protein
MFGSERRLQPWLLSFSEQKTIEERKLAQTFISWPNPKTGFRGIGVKITIHRIRHI